MVTLQYTKLNAFQALRSVPPLGISVVFAILAACKSSNTSVCCVWKKFVYGKFRVRFIPYNTFGVYGDRTLFSSQVVDLPDATECIAQVFAANEKGRSDPSRVIIQAISPPSKLLTSG